MDKQNYWARAARDEVVFRPAWRSFVVFWVAAFAFVVGPLANPRATVKWPVGIPIAIVCLAAAVGLRYTRRYRVTADAVEAEFALTGQPPQRARIDDIIRVDVRRGIIHRALGMAHVHLHTGSAQGVAVRMFGVLHALDFKEYLLERGASDDGVTGMWR
jgi:uncharacterized membrane protein YdbT with pleckstrin-like domain